MCFAEIADDDHGKDWLCNDGLEWDVTVPSSDGGPGTIEVHMIRYDTEKTTNGYQIDLTKRDPAGWFDLEYVTV